MDKVETRLRGLMLVSFVMVLINVAVGAILTLYLDFSPKVTAVIVGTIVLLQGMFYFIRYLYDGLGKKVFAADLVVAVADIVLGAFTIFFEFTSVKYVGFVFGLYLIGDACEKFYYSIKFRAKQDPCYPVLCVITFFLIIMGVFVIINPFSEFILSSKLCGLFMLCAGVFEGLVCKLFFDKADVLLKLF